MSYSHYIDGTLFQSYHFLSKQQVMKTGTVMWGCHNVVGPAGGSIGLFTFASLALWSSRGRR